MLNVEIKDASPESIAVILALTEPYRRAHPSSILYSSFDTMVLRQIRQHTDDALLGIIYEDTRSFAAWKKDVVTLHATSLHIPSSLTTTSFVNEAHALGIAVYCWTINDIHEAQKLEQCGVDGIFTDHPEYFTATATEHQ